MRQSVVTLSGLLLLGCSTVSIAADPAYFIGAQLGYHDNSFDIDFSDPSGNNLNTSVSADGLSGGIYTGVKLYVNDRVFVTPEVNISETNASGDLSSTAKLEAKLSYGIGVLLGMDVSPGTGVYGRLGYQKTDYEIKQDTISEQETFDGFRYGIGIETDIASQLAMRLEWSQTSYSESSASGNGFSASVEPTENLFQAGITYRF